jgi:hypothetical protein
MYALPSRQLGINFYLLLLQLLLGTTSSKAKKVKSQADEGQSIRKGKPLIENKPFASIFAKANSTSSATTKDQTNVKPKRTGAKIKNDKTELACSTRKLEESSNPQYTGNTSDKKKSASEKEIIVELRKNGEQIYLHFVC